MSYNCLVYFKIWKKGYSGQSFRLPPSPMRGVYFYYEYLYEYEVKIGNAWNLVGSMSNRCMQKNLKKQVRCHDL